jgi:hypothetical protein
MPMRKKKQASPFTGLWHIVSMSQWEEDELNEEGQAFIEIKPGGFGHFQCGLLSGDVDCFETHGDGKPAIEWSWEGVSEMNECSGRGWATLEGDLLQGMIFIHGDDHSDFVAQRAKKQRRPKRRSS